MIAAFADADQLRRRPTPVNTSMRRTGSGICLCSEIDMCRSPHRLRTSPLRPHDERCPRNTAYNSIDEVKGELIRSVARLCAAVTAPKSGGQLFLRGKPLFIEPVFVDDRETLVRL